MKKLFFLIILIGVLLFWHFHNVDLESNFRIDPPVSEEYDLEVRKEDKVEIKREPANLPKEESVPEENLDIEFIPPSAKVFICETLPQNCVNTIHREDFLYLINYYSSLNIPQREFQVMCEVLSERECGEQIDPLHRVTTDYLLKSAYPEFDEDAIHIAYLKDLAFEMKLFYTNERNWTKGFDLQLKSVITSGLEEYISSLSEGDREQNEDTHN